jgi:tRNA A22 N-methylase
MNSEVLSKLSKSSRGFGLNKKQQDKLSYITSKRGSQLSISGMGSQNVTHIMDEEEQVRF